MPILVPLSELKPGMKLASSIINKYVVLLPHGHKLREQDIASLIRLVPGQRVHIADPELDDFVEFDQVAEAQSVAHVIRGSAATVLDQVDTIIQSGKALTTDNVDDIKDTIEQAIAFIMKNPVTMAMVEQSKDWDDYLKEHSSNVFYLSLLIGNKMRFYLKTERERLSSAHFIRNASDLNPLGVAALFHDISMAPMAELYYKTDPLTEPEKNLLRMHPHRSAEMLPDSIGAVIRNAIRQHHENNKGTGYPNRLPPSMIGIFARVIRIADAYCSAVAPAARDRKRSEAGALFDMIHGDCRDFYDPELLAVFGTLMPPFPIGAKLHLLDGRYAVVVRHNPDDPFRPEVIVAFDEFNNPLAREQLEPCFKMGDKKDAMISSFAGEDVSFLNELLYDLPYQQDDQKHPLHDIDLFETPRRMR